jgi:hypothetical protein
MKAGSIKRNVLRSLLFLHFIGLGMSIGTRLADFVINRATSGASLQTLSFGRDLTGQLGRTLILPGFWLIVVTGVAMTLVRYGLRAPIWVWIKICLNIVGIGIAGPLVAPALEAARQWAHWSVEHNQLAPQFQESTAQASLYGGIVFALFLLNIPVAIWKPFLSVKMPSFIRAKGAGGAADLQ